MLYFAIHYTYYSDNPAKRWEEFYAGLKPNKICKGYELISLVRRFILIFALIFLKSFSPPVVIAIMCITQIFYCGFLTYLRPFEAVQDNVVEVLNEFIYTSLLIIFSYYNEIGRWSTGMASGVFYLLVSNNMLLLFIIGGFAAVKCVRF